MMEKWQQWSEQFIALTQREKVIVYLGTVVVLGYLLLNFAVAPYQDVLTNHKNKRDQIVSQMSALNQQIADINNALSSDPNETIKKEIGRLQTELNEVEGNLDNVMTDYVPPNQMAKELTDLLNTKDGIRVIGLAVSPPKLIQHNTDLTLPDYYRHEFGITLEGEYFPLMAFMESITQENKQFRVQDLQYKVISHPVAHMSLTLLTISDSKNVIRL